MTSALKARVNPLLSMLSHIFVSTKHWSVCSNPWPRVLQYNEPLDIPARPLCIYVNTVPGRKAHITECFFISKQSSFSEIHKVGMDGIFVLLVSETKSYVNLNLCNKSKLTLKVIRLYFQFIYIGSCRKMPICQLLNYRKTRMLK